MSEHGPAKQPCPSCPYRKDCPSGVWVEAEYDKLPGYDLPTGQQPSRAFFCHLNTGRLCAGWCAVHDMDESLGLRLAFFHGILSEDDINAALDYVSPIPVFESGAAAAEHGRAEINTPGLRAQKAIDKLQAQRARQQRRTDD